MSVAKPDSQLPASLRYARALLWIQGGIWAWLAASTAFTAEGALVHVLAGHRTFGAAGAEVGWGLAVAALTGSFAITKIRLGIRLKDGRDRIRKTVLGIEIAMTCLGALITAGADPSGGMPADFVAFAALVGGGLSLAAAIGLLRRPARNYFASPGSLTSRPADNHGDSKVDYSGPLPALARIWPGFVTHSHMPACYA